MKLKDFLNYRTNCPSCNMSLITVLHTAHSMKKQTLKFEDDRLVVIFRMDSLNKKQEVFKGGYSFGLEDNSWCLEFYDYSHNVRMEVISLTLLDKFKEFDKHMKKYYFQRECSNSKCKRYDYCSSDFTLNLSNPNIGELILEDEFLGLTKLIGSDFRIIRITNRHNKNKCDLNIGKAESEVAAQCNYVPGYREVFISDYIEVPLLKITSAIELGDRLNKLLIFT